MSADAAGPQATKAALVAVTTRLDHIHRTAECTQSFTSLRIAQTKGSELFLWTLKNDSDPFYSMS